MLPTAYLRFADLPLGARFLFDGRVWLKDRHWMAMATNGEVRGFTYEIVTV